MSSGRGESPGEPSSAKGSRSNDSQMVVVDQNPSAEGTPAGQFPYAQTPSVQNPTVQTPSTQNQSAEGTQSGQFPYAQTPSVQNPTVQTPSTQNPSAEGTQSGQFPYAQTPSVQNPTVQTPSTQNPFAHSGKGFAGHLMHKKDSAPVPSKRGTGATSRRVPGEPPRNPSSAGQSRPSEVRQNVADQNPSKVNKTGNDGQPSGQKRRWANPTPAGGLPDSTSSGRVTCSNCHTDIFPNLIPSFEGILINYCMVCFVRTGEIHAVLVTGNYPYSKPAAPDTRVFENPTDPNLNVDSSAAAGLSVHSAGSDRGHHHEDVSSRSFHEHDESARQWNNGAETVDDSRVRYVHIESSIEFRERHPEVTSETTQSDQLLEELSVDSANTSSSFFGTNVNYNPQRRHPTSFEYFSRGTYPITVNRTEPTAQTQANQGTSSGPAANTAQQDQRSEATQARGRETPNGPTNSRSNQQGGGSNHNQAQANRNRPGQGISQGLYQQHPPNQGMGIYYYSSNQQRELTDGGSANSVPLYIGTPLNPCCPFIMSFENGVTVQLPTLDRPNPTSEAQAHQGASTISASNAAHHDMQYIHTQAMAAATLFQGPVLLQEATLWGRPHIHGSCYNHAPASWNHVVQGIPEGHTLHICLRCLVVYSGTYCWAGLGIYPLAPKVCHCLTLMYRIPNYPQVFALYTDGQSRLAAFEALIQKPHHVDRWLRHWGPYLRSTGGLTTEHQCYY